MVELRSRLIGLEVRFTAIIDFVSSAKSMFTYLRGAYIKRLNHLMINNYLVKPEGILLNNPRDLEERIIQQYSLSLR